MTDNLTHEAVAELIYELRESFALLDGGPDDWDLGDRTADMLEALAAKLETCEKYRDAYAECDRIGTQAVRDLEAEVARLRMQLQNGLPEHRKPFVTSRAALQPKETEPPKKKLDSL